MTSTQIATEGGSSLIGDSQFEIVPPNFITECFFLAHILIKFTGEKLERGYQKNYDNIRRA